MSNKNYKQLRQELDEIVAELESDSLDIDDALSYYQKAQELIAETEKYLNNTKAKIKKIDQA